MSEPAATAIDEYCPPRLKASVQNLAPLLYADLKKMARRERSRLFSPATLQTTALVNEAYLRLRRSPEFESHTHFLRVAAVTMRHLLINRVEMQRAAKRGGGAVHVPLEDVEETYADFKVAQEDTVLAIHNALLRLAKFAPRLAEVVECRFFAGYTEQEIAEALGVTERTVRRDWRAARAWLARELGDAIAIQALPGAAAGQGQEP